MALTKDQYVFRVGVYLGYHLPAFPIPKALRDAIEMGFEIGYSAELCAHMLEKGWKPETVTGEQ